MGSQFKYTIKDKCATLEEYITPIPTIVFHHVVCFLLYPNIKSNKRNATKPSVKKDFCELSSRLDNFLETINNLMAWTAIERFSGTRKQLKANKQYATKSLLGEKKK